MMIFRGSFYEFKDIYRFMQSPPQSGCRTFPRSLPMLFLCPHILPLIPATTDLFSICIILSFLKCHMNGIILCIPLRDGLSSLSIMLWMFISVVTGY